MLQALKDRRENEVGNEIITANKEASFPWTGESGEEEAGLRTTDRQTDRVSG